MRLAWPLQSWRTTPSGWARVCVKLARAMQSIPGIGEPARAVADVCVKLARAMQSIREALRVAVAGSCVCARNAIHFLVAGWKGRTRRESGRRPRAAAQRRGYTANPRAYNNQGTFRLRC